MDDMIRGSANPYTDFKKILNMHTTLHTLHILVPQQQYAFNIRVYRAVTVKLHAYLLKFRTYELFRIAVVAIRSNGLCLLLLITFLLITCQYCVSLHTSVHTFLRTYVRKSFHS